MTATNGLNWFEKLSFVTHATSQLESRFCRLISGKNQSSNESISLFIPTEKSAVKQSEEKSGDFKFTVPTPKDLIRLCRQGEWDVFVKKCQSEPERIFWTGAHGQNLLHFLCTRRPNLRAVTEFTTLYRESLIKQDKDGCLPIHMAMTNGASHEVICMLINQAPETIFHANKWNYDPLDWIWKRCKYELNHVDEENEEEERIWNTIEELVRAASLYNGAKQNGTILHLAMDFDCPIDLIKCITKRFPKMAMEKDVDGKTCLARAVSSSHLPSLELIQTLLKVDPTSALERDVTGRIPLHLAISNQVRWKTGLNDLFHAAPLSIHVKDPITNLCPFQLMASQANKKDSQLSLTDLFEVLCLSPNCVTD